jgi:hypothetical protein
LQLLEAGTEVNPTLAGLDTKKYLFIIQYTTFLKVVQIIVVLVHTERERVHFAVYAANM